MTKLKMGVIAGSPCFAGTPTPFVCLSKHLLPKIIVTGAKTVVCAPKTIVSAPFT